MAAAASPTMPGLPRLTPGSVRCGWLTDPTRCTIAPLPDLNFGSIKTLRPSTNKGERTQSSPTSFRDGPKDQTRNLEVPGSMLRIAPERRVRRTRKSGSVTVADGVRKDEEFSGTREVEERHRINEANLDKWMQEHVEGFRGPLTVLQFKGGQSNPTYQLNTPGRSYVMRRRPFGKLLPSAHAVDREFRVIAALSKQGFPVARAYALCTDETVIGAAFYIMSMEEGRVFWDPMLPSQSPEARRQIFSSKIETLAKLHAYDPPAIGLGDFGKPGNYFARQVDRWTKQYRASETQQIPEF